jgi:hypothetical protein
MNKQHKAICKEKNILESAFSIVAEHIWILYWKYEYENQYYFGLQFDNLVILKKTKQLYKSSDCDALSKRWTQETVYTQELLETSRKQTIKRFS